MNKEAKKYAYEISPVGCIGTDCGNACTNKFCNKDINDAYLAGGLSMKEKAGKAFCNEMNKESVMCKLSKQRDLACRDTCPAYESFIDKLNE